MASLEIKSLENVISAKKTFTNQGWKVMWNVSDEIVYIKRENSSSFLKISKNLKMIGVHCKENIFEMSFAKLSLNDIESTLKTLEKQVALRSANETSRDSQNGDELLQEIETNDNERPGNRKKSEDFRRYSTDDTIEAGSGPKILWKCDSCSKEFRCKEQIKLHKEVMHKVKVENRTQSDPKQEGLKPYCSDCKRYFCSNTSLENHKSRKTHKEKLFVSDSLECKICNRRFETKGGQISHFKSNLHKNASKWTKKKFNLPAEKVNLRRQSLVAKPGIFKCKICNLQFLRYTDLDLHKKFKHNKPKVTVENLRAYRKPQSLGASTIATAVEAGTISNKTSRQEAENPQKEAIVKVEPNDPEVKLEKIDENQPATFSSPNSYIIISSDSEESTSESESDDD